MPLHSCTLGRSFRLVINALVFLYFGLGVKMFSTKRTCMSMQEGKWRSSSVRRSHFSQISNNCVPSHFLCSVHRNSRVDGISPESPS